MQRSTVVIMIIFMSFPLIAMEWYQRSVGSAVEQLPIVRLDSIIAKYKITNEEEIAVLKAIENNNRALVKQQLNSQNFLNKLSTHFFDAAIEVATAVNDTKLAETLQNYRYARNYSNMFQ